MIPAMPTIPAAIPPTTAPVETVVPELVASPLSPVEEGLDVREVSEVRVKEVAGSDVFEEEVMEVLEVVEMGIIDVTEVEVDEELEDEEVEEEVEEEVLELVEEVEDGVGVGGLLVVVEGDGLFTEVGFPTVETRLDVVWVGSPPRP
jgi:hypothetical protein